MSHLPYRDDFATGGQLLSNCLCKIDLLSVMAKERVNYIDALRGFAMYLVVLVHVLIFGFGMNDSFIKELFVTFHVPMFFLISGYVAYKGVDQWNGALFKKMIKKKTVMILIPSTVFWILFVTFLCKGKLSPWEYIVNKGFVTYWFTFTLFALFLAYYVILLIANKFKRAKRAPLGLFAGRRSAGWYLRTSVFVYFLASPVPLLVLLS